MGQAARDFILFLRASGQSIWQILPINPTGYGNSPYQSFSSFAGNPYLIDLDDLKDDGLLLPAEYQTLFWGTDPAGIDYGILYQKRYGVLRKAVCRLKNSLLTEMEAFCMQHSGWLEDYALFMAIKDYYQGRPWSQWPEPLKLRRPDAMEQMKSQLSEDIFFWKGVQFLFFRQWYRLKSFANQSGISIIGDLPIYVAEDSADVWANPIQFQLDESLNPIEVAGCPPDGFSADGQLWGNPLFDWDYMKKDGYQWWIKRIAFQFHIYDVLRIDHFRGFDAYYAIPAGSSTARIGRWRPGPGLSFFQSLEVSLGHQNIIAEDLGFLTPSVRRLLYDTGYPGMKVLEFAFDSRDGSGIDYLPHNYPRNCVAYVGTHDNETALGWLASAPRPDVSLAREYLHLDSREGEHWGMMRAVWSSVADRAIVQMQDVLGIGREGRMNIPSTLGGNWRWRLLPGYNTPELEHRLWRQMELYGRIPAAWETSAKS